jgi:hypothetical protein
MLKDRNSASKNLMKMWPAALAAIAITFSSPAFCVSDQAREKLDKIRDLLPPDVFKERPLSQEIPLGPAPDDKAAYQRYKQQYQQKLRQLEQATARINR